MRNKIWIRVRRNISIRINLKNNNFHRRNYDDLLPIYKEEFVLYWFKFLDSVCWLTHMFSDFRRCYNDVYYYTVSRLEAYERRSDERFLRFLDETKRKYFGWKFLWYKSIQVTVVYFGNRIWKRWQNIWPKSSNYLMRVKITQKIDFKLKIVKDIESFISENDFIIRLLRIKEIFVEWNQHLISCFLQRTESACEKLIKW